MRAPDYRSPGILLVHAAVAEREQVRVDRVVVGGVVREIARGLALDFGFGFGARNAVVVVVAQYSTVGQVLRLVIPFACRLRLGHSSRLPEMWGSSSCRPVTPWNPEIRHNPCMGNIDDRCSRVLNKYCLLAGTGIVSWAVSAWPGA